MVRRIYWVSTVLLAVAMLAAGIQDIRHAPELIEAVDRLGYPHYHLSLIGFAKLAGAPLLLVPRFPRLKEWVYAGFTIDFVGAVAAHVIVRDTFEQTAPALFCTLLVAVSYTTYRMTGPKFPVRVHV